MLQREGSGRYLPVDILNLLLGSKAKLWIVWNDETHAVDAAIVTEIVHYPRLDELRIWLIGGRNMKAWGVPCRDILEEFARANGCAYVTGGMRRGWLRIGGPGYRETGITFEKAL